MPSKSPAQARLMAAVAHDPKFARQVGISQSVGKEFYAADHGYADGGSLPEDGSRARAAATAPGALSVLGALSDMITGGLRGAVKTTLGWPGDLERLLGTQLPEVADTWRSGAPLAWNLRSAGEALARTHDAPTLLPNSEDLNRWLPPATSLSMPPGTNPYETVASNLPATPGQVAKLGRAASEAMRGALSTLGQPVPRRLAQLGAVRLKGGNFDRGSVDNYLGSFDALDAPLVGDFGRTEPTVKWSDKQLRNYLTKDLGSPTDPLLQVEKEGRLHIDPDALAGDDLRRLVGVAGDPARLERLRAMAGDEGPRNGANLLQWVGAKADLDYLTKHAELSGGAPLTPWGALSDSTLLSSPAKRHVADAYGTEPEYAVRAASGHLDPSIMEQRFKSGLGPGDVEDIKKDYGWIAKNPDAPIWRIANPFEANAELGFDHVLDYLEAAQKAAPGSHNNSFVPDASMRELLAQNNLRPEYRMALAMHDAGLGLTPEQLQRLSVADAVRKTHEWNKLIESGMGGPKNPDLFRGHVPHKDYPDGMRWVEFKPQAPEPLKLTSEGLPEGWTLSHEPALEDPATGRPWENGEYDTHPWKLEPPPKEGSPWPFPDHGTAHTTRETALKRAQEVSQKIAERKARAELEAGLNAEGESMGHCVGGYCSEVADRGTRIYSLRDAAGNPHVTVETSPGRPRTEPDLEELDNLIGLNSSYEREAQVRLGDDAKPMDWLKDLMDFHPNQRNRMAAARAYQRYVERPPSIVQVKGKQNKAPVDKYRPYVQDFVRNSGPWESVGDFHNTGLWNAKGILRQIQYLKPDFQFPEGTPTYLTDAEAQPFRDMIKSLDPRQDLRREAGYAAGGHVLAPARAQLIAAHAAER